MFGKKKRDRDPEEYEAYSADEGYTPLFTDAEETEQGFAPEGGSGFDAPGYDEAYTEQGSSWAVDDDAE